MRKAILVAIMALLLWLVSEQVRSPRLVISGWEINLDLPVGTQVSYLAEGVRIRNMEMTVLILHDSISLEGERDHLMYLLYEDITVKGGDRLVQDVVFSLPDVVQDVEVKGDQRFVARSWSGSVYTSARTEDAALSFGKNIRPRASDFELGLRKAARIFGWR